MATTRAPFSTNDLNAAINTVARRMTSAAPSSDLRARIMATIDAPQPRWGWRLAIAGGAIGVVALTTAIVWRTPVAPATQIAAAPPVAAPTSRIADPTATPIASSPVLSTASVRHSATQRVVVMPSAEELAWRARAVQALDQPDALVVEPLEHPRLSIDPIDITPLSVAPLTVPVLNSGGSQKPIS